MSKKYDTLFVYGKYMKYQGDICVYICTYFRDVILILYSHNFVFKRKNGLVREYRKEF